MPDWGFRFGFFFLELKRYDTVTVTPHGKRQIILHVEHTQRAPPQKKTVSSRYVLG